MKLPEKHISLSSRTDMITLAHPLKYLGIDFFSYTRFCFDGTSISLLTHTDWYESFLKEEIPNTIVYNLETGCHLWCELFPEKAVKHASQNFNIDNGIQFTYRKKDYIDVYSFATKKGRNSTHMYGLYLAQRDLLEKFIFYFLKKTEKLINEAEKQKIIIPETMNNWETVPSSFLIDAENKKIFLNKIGYARGTELFTTRELDCLYHIARGKSAKETSIRLNLSRRTIEDHINKAKARLGCYSRSQLIDLYLEYHDETRIIRNSFK